MAIRLKTFLSTNEEMKDLPTATVDPPYEIVGEFFSSELDNLKVREEFILDLLSTVEEAESDPGISLKDGLGGHEVFIENGTVTIDAVYRDEGASVSISCSDFGRILKEWHQFLVANAEPPSSPS
ncbi:hypothetical protein GC197_00470 [bacterium]|nr:hypothetical protein [bacterium]